MLYCLNTSATIVKKHTLDSLIEGSGLIVEGTVLKVEYFKGTEHLLPKTSYTVCELEIIAGNHESDCVIIDVPGAVIEYKVSGYAGMPNLNEKERYILFLRKNNVYTSPFTGWWQDVYKIINKEDEQYIQAYEGSLVYFINDQGHIIYEEISKNNVIPNYFFDNIEREQYFMSKEAFVESIQTMTTIRLFNSLDIPRGLPSEWNCRLDREIRESH